MKREKEWKTHETNEKGKIILMEFDSDWNHTQMNGQVNEECGEKSERTEKIANESIWKEERKDHKNWYWMRK